MASAPLSTEMEQEFDCPICLENLRDPMVLDCGHSFCQRCITDYCEKWETLGNLECPVCKFKFQKGDFRQNWQLANIIEKMKLMPMSSGKENLCLRHKEKLQLFCKEDEELVCFVCEHSPEHQGHTILLLEQAAQQNKEKMQSRRQETVANFTSLHQWLKEQESHQLAEIEELEKEVTGKRDELLARLSEELSSLENFIREMEEKHQQPVSELLQDIRGTLQRYEKKETFENPKAFMEEVTWRVLIVCCNAFLENALKHFKYTLAWADPKLRVMVTLDPASASSCLLLSECLKTFRCKTMTWKHGLVLGTEGFTAGCHFWDVLVRSGEGWAVGVARKSVKDKVTLTPSEGIWAVGRWKGQYKALIKGADAPLTGKISYIRICLNYDCGQVAFFDARTSALVCEFTGASFCGETLHPFFAVYDDGWLELFP